VNAIPTKYAGTQFRSRLEARWAAFFDLVGWSWEYEPIDLDGYIPDFLVRSKASGWGEPRLIEVKPATSLDELIPAINKVLDSGWSDYAIVVGAVLFGQKSGGTVLGLQVHCHCDFELARELVMSDHATNVKQWREAGNRVQWRARS
jgi:hypothetical protein